MSAVEKMDRDAVLVQRFVEFRHDAAAEFSEQEALLLAVAMADAASGNPPLPAQTAPLVPLLDRIGTLESDAPADQEARARAVAGVAAAEERLEAARQARDACDDPVHEAERVRDEFQADLDRLVTLEATAEREAVEATSSKAIRAAAERCAKAATATTQARKAVDLASGKVDEARRKIAPAVAAASAHVADCEAGVRDARAQVDAIDARRAHSLLAARVERERARREAMDRALARQRARVEGRAASCGGLVGLGLEQPEIVTPPPQKYAVRLLIKPGAGGTIAHLDDAEIAALWRFTGGQVEAFKLDMLMGNTGSGTAAQVLGFELPPPKQPQAPPAEKVYPTRLTDDAADRLAHYLATGGSHETIVGEGQIRGSDPTLFARVRPPSANEIRALAKLPRLSRDELPLGEADDGPAGWAHDGAILERLELALKPGGALAIARGQKNVGRPKSLGGVVAGHAPVDLSVEEGRKYRRAQEGKSNEPQRAIRYDGTEPIVERDAR